MRQCVSSACPQLFFGLSVNVAAYTTPSRGHARGLRALQLPKALSQASLSVQKPTSSSGYRARYGVSSGTARASPTRAASQEASPGLSQMLQEVDESRKPYATTLNGHLAKASETPVPSTVPGDRTDQVLQVDSTRAARVLARALQLQWDFGFPFPPPSEDKLTHGQLWYPAGMQPLTARIILSQGLVPGGTLLDPFSGAGTVLIEGLRAGRQVLGFDVSPLAVFTSSHQTWIASDEELVQLRTAIEGCVLKAREKLASVGNEIAPERLQMRPDANPDQSQRGGRLSKRMWTLLADAISSQLQEGQTNGQHHLSNLAPGSSCSPRVATSLWFCYLSAIQKGEKRSKRLKHRKGRRATKRSRDGDSRIRMTDPSTDAIGLFETVGFGFCAALSELREAYRAAKKDSGGQVMVPDLVTLKDARNIALREEVDAIITSPPYPAVYNYLSHAREKRALLSAMSSGLQEIWKGEHAGHPRPQNELLFLSQDAPRERDWPSVWTNGEIGSFRSLRKDPFAFKAVWEESERAWLTAAHNSLRPGGRICIIVGDGGGIDTLRSTVAGSQKVGFKCIASASIFATAKEGVRTKGQRRREHAILLERI
mmetsp:Transcript_4347/g.15608  ORF Transcript_4347/g.15608 Transcript_4347/m.15608 type:complete len:598 (-) Transcript_4347:579-2372(-)